MTYTTTFPPSGMGSQGALYCEQSLKYKQILNPATVSVDNVWKTLQTEEQLFNQLCESSNIHFKPMKPLDRNAAPNMPYEEIVSRIIAVTEYQHFISLQTNSGCSGCAPKNEFRPTSNEQSRFRNSGRISQNRSRTVNYQTTSSTNLLPAAILVGAAISMSKFPMGAARAMTAVAMNAVVVPVMAAGTLALTVGTVAAAAVAVPVIATGAVVLTTGAIAVSALALPVIMMGAVASPILLPAVILGSMF